MRQDKTRQRQMHDTKNTRHRQRQGPAIKPQNLSVEQKMAGRIRVKGALIHVPRIFWNFTMTVSLCLPLYCPVLSCPVLSCLLRVGERERET
jgi:hypothetical protein